MKQAGLFRGFRPWMFSFVAAALMWVITLAWSGGHGGEILSVALAFSVFSVLVGTGQMLVIASGPGNIDLSIPSVIVLSAYLSMGLMEGRDALIPAGFALALGVGLLAGVLNILSVLVLRLPPLIATLAWSFMFQSLAMHVGGEATVKPPAMLAALTVERVAGVQILVILAVLASVLISLLLRRSVAGRYLLATGQSAAAAQLTGINTGRVRLLAYAACGAFSGITGFLLASFTGGATLSMGNAYLMESIAVVVIGGTSVAGGQANPIGIWGAALFLNLLTTMLNTMRVEAPIRFILTGLIIILVLPVATRQARA